MSIPMTTKELYQIYLKHRNICTDTRKISESCLFFALKGENFDANAFASKAIEAGAAFAIIDDERYADSDKCILVEDALVALQELSAFHRKQLKIPVIGITGSNGKTTTKELIRSVLSQHCRTFATEGNLNNHIGVPLSLLAIGDDCDIAIIEMGANHQKEIAFLCSLAQPGYGLITNVGKAHLEGFGGVEGVKMGKGELYEYLAKTNGTVFINTDNPTLVDMSRDREVIKVVGYGKGATNFVSGGLKELSPFLTIEWQLKGREDAVFIAESNLPGTYNFENILAAICIGSFFKLSTEQINQGIKAYQPKNNRSQILKTENNTLICDYYNANPSSMVVALDNLHAVPAENKVIILGDMFELGLDSSLEHRSIVEKVMEITASRKIFIGEEFYNLKDKSAEFYRTTSEASLAIQKTPPTGSTILLKGSRGMKLEDLISNL
ncbi:MAG: UDP-N-acetylmuramoyl-tripeptide--D-alanyl-D-alanine ligase [Daejeonella sp.]|uniref:UDP-N-acetylmuramoyl-tripeptide--D-alanyl-D- alanine ligase n=1 Tax=Daejeonella sp. TaxID=2805397 RepID=UPI003C787051